ncbi:histidine kinase [Dyadobacter sp. CY345]|uniref:histidine kinase dimerization/phosphoacceptor domain -containing protein n=1 Tax=Dyadobacter sp. CY345 TaxID=2909335 RepID=UPI001F3A7FF1|nr:histidine kinase dimerization/phosphoacceptor domain -containing protein [Dyadobacter sp. CY345]MCF2446982.1 histidine kinase [Dyadobacter sp. CY345]
MFRSQVCDVIQHTLSRLRSVSILFCALVFILPVKRTDAQSISSIKADELLDDLQSVKSDTNRVRNLLILGNYYLKKTLNPVYDLDSVLVFATQAQELSLRLRYKSGVENAAILKGKIYIKQKKAGSLSRIVKTLSDTSRIILLIESGVSNLRPTFTQKAKRDSAMLLFQQAERISQKIGNQKWLEESHCMIGTTYLLNKDWSNGKAFFTKVIEARQRAGDKPGEIKALLRLSTTTFCDDCRENMKALERALALAREIGDQAQEMLILMEMGYEHFQLDKGDTKIVEQIALQVLAIQKKIGFQPLIQAYHALAEASVYKAPGEYGYLSNAYYLLSDVSQAKGDLNKKLLYILEVVKGIENSGLSDELDLAYYKLGNAYFELGQFDKSMEYHQKSLALSRQKGQLFIHIGLATRLAMTLLNQGKASEALSILQNVTRKNRLYTYEDNLLLAQSFGACYNVLKQYRLAEKYYLESVTWSKETISYFQYMAWRRISQFYVTSGQYQKADIYLNRLLAAPSTKIIPSHQIEVQLMSFKVDSAQGNYSEAIKHYQKYHALNDSIFNERKSNQINQLSIQYETEKKDQDLRLKQQAIQILTEQSQRQQNQLQQAATFRNGMIAGAILLILLLVLGFSSYRLKQQNNKLLEAKQIEINRKNHSLELIVQEKDHLLIDKEQLLKDKDHLLEEREWMLMEMHHRVKNNLQIISSLLNSQGSFLEDKVALSAIRESQNRVHAMALIHQKLYQTNRLSSVPMVTYVQEIVDYLINSFNMTNTVYKEISVAPIDLNVTFAVPLGLILNEAVTNSLKYAFPGGRYGTLKIEFIEQGSKTYRLIIGDDGIGFPANLNPSKSRTLGMSLIRGLSEQIDGILHISQQNGVQISLTFVEEKNVRVQA